jgi:hypothetical protein
MIATLNYRIAAKRETMCEWQRAKVVQTKSFQRPGCKQKQAPFSNSACLIYKYPTD